MFLFSNCSFFTLSIFVSWFISSFFSSWGSECPVSFPCSGMWQKRTQWGSGSSHSESGDREELDPEISIYIVLEIIITYCSNNLTCCCLLSRMKMVDVLKYFNRTGHWGCNNTYFWKLTKHYAEFFPDFTKTSLTAPGPGFYPTYISILLWNYVHWTIPYQSL